MIDKIDKFFNKVIPKKLVVLILATILCFCDKLEGDWWGIIASIYTGTNGLQHILTPIIRKKDE